MAIETRGSLDNIVSNYSAREWSQSVKMDPVSELKFQDAPPPGVTNEERQLTFGELLSKSL